MVSDLGVMTPLEVSNDQKKIIMNRTRNFLIGISLCFIAAGTYAQQWVNPHFDTHRMDYRDLGYPAQNLIPADNSSITACDIGTAITTSDTLNINNGTITTCNYPIYYRGPGHMTIAGTNNFSGNSIVI